MEIGKNEEPLGAIGTEVQTIDWSWFTGKRERNVLSLSFVVVEFACFFLFLPRAETAVTVVSASSEAAHRFHGPGTPFFRLLG